MYWQEEVQTQEFVVSDDIVDLAFSFQGATLPVDHAYALSQAVVRELPWLEDEPEAGLHTIHGAESGNGWERPDADTGGVLYLSRRTRLVLRLPKRRLDEARVLTGKEIDVSGNRLQIGAAAPRLLSKATTLYARYVVLTQDANDEDSFVRVAAQELRSRNIRFKKILCGKTNAVAMPDQPLLTRSLLVADVPMEDSVRLQQIGLGMYRTLGCGLFIAHKSV